MSFSLPSIETLSIILDEPFLSNQTITFGEESIDVNKFVLSAHSTYFRSLWLLEFGDKLENLIDCAICKHQILSKQKEMHCSTLNFPITCRRTDTTSAL
ncbi:hypothetical protein GEMRC1_000862 [Eukaryota sp. GEM-RC1]